MLLAKFFRQRHKVVDVVAVPVQASMGDGVELRVDQAWCTAETSLFGQAFEKSPCLGLDVGGLVAAFPPVHDRCGEPGLSSAASQTVLAQAGYGGLKAVQERFGLVLGCFPLVDLLGGEWFTRHHRWARS